MNPPRINLSRFTSGSAVTDTDGSTPKVRLRAPTPAGSRGARPKSGPRGLLAPLPAAGIVLVLVALVGYLGVYTASSKRTQVLFAVHALPAGTVIGAGDLRANGIAGEPSVLSALLPASETQQVIGQRLSSAIPAGAPVPAGALAGRQASASAFTLAVPEFDVTGEALQPGDRVTVLATFGAGSGSASTRPLARNLEVLSVGEVPANAEPSTTTIPVAVALTEPSNASQLALADEDGKIDLLLEGSRASTGTIPQANQGSAP
jgi:Flp pilus assembly protein CpaB